eukprot:ctg_254.g106
MTRQLKTAVRPSTPPASSAELKIDGGMETRRERDGTCSRGEEAVDRTGEGKQTRGWREEGERRRNSMWGPVAGGSVGGDAYPSERERDREHGRVSYRAYLRVPGPRLFAEHAFRRTCPSAPIERQQMQEILGWSARTPRAAERVDAVGELTTSTTDHRPCHGHSPRPIALIGVHVDRGVGQRRGGVRADGRGVAGARAAQLDRKRGGVCGGVAVGAADGAVVPPGRDVRARHQQAVAQQRQHQYRQQSWQGPGDCSYRRSIVRPRRHHRARSTGSGGGCRVPLCVMRVPPVPRAGGDPVLQCRPRLGDVYDAAGLRRRRAQLAVALQDDPALRSLAAVAGGLRRFHHVVGAPHRPATVGGLVARTGAAPARPGLDLQTVHAAVGGVLLQRHQHPRGHQRPRGGPVAHHRLRRGAAQRRSPARLVLHPSGRPGAPARQPPLLAGPGVALHRRQLGAVRTQLVPGAGRDPAAVLHPAGVQLSVQPAAAVGPDGVSTTPAAAGQPQDWQAGRRAQPLQPPQPRAADMRTDDRAAAVSRAAVATGGVLCLRVRSAAAGVAACGLVLKRRW